MLIRKEKIEFFEDTLLDFFARAGRWRLPWRKSKLTAYEVWVSEIMLQQTQVSRVIEYYPKFLKRFPDVAALARASWEIFLPYYEGLGYYARGRNMLLTARTVVSQYHGIFPRGEKELQALPGIGPYTAAAILSFAYNADHIAWDTNVSRVIGRFFCGGKHLVQEREYWQRALCSPKRKLNAALMDFGSAICTARPKCGLCPLRPECVYYQGSGQREVRQETKEPPAQSPFLHGMRIAWREAEAHVFLHEQHTRYFSAARKSFKPFILPPRSNTRAGIKRYFFERYQLKLSVRPPHARGYLNGKPVLWINAQILAGKPTFSIFLKKDKERYTKKRTVHSSASFL